MASNAGYARAILQQRSNSHPFEERCLEFREAIKVGRAVARCKPLCDNAIFDCKVLSRNHALLWFDNGKFLLRDTRSSNGTFINNQRLSAANEDSPPEELFSGDVVQFGVEVMESAKKMTHGCIVLCIKLYYPDGEEAVRPKNHISNHIMMPSNLLYEQSTFMQQDVTVIPDQASMLPFMFSDNSLPRVDMFMGPTNNNNNNQLVNGTSSLNSNNTGSSSSIINRTNLVTVINNNTRPNKSAVNNNNNINNNKASQKEQLLRQRLQLVEQTLEEAHLAADKSWKACIEEDLLLSKIETLQKKLEFLMRASKVAKSKQAYKENSSASHEPQDNASEANSNSTNDTKAIECVNKNTSNEIETINDLEQQLKEKVLNYIDDKAKYELIAKDAIKKALQKEYLAFQRIHDIEVLLKSSEEECQNLKESNERLEQIITSRDVVHQKQAEEMTQERLILMKDIDELKQANSQLSKQYENVIQESKKKIDEFEHRLEFASQQICDIQLKDKQLANLRYQLMVVNSLYTQADENNQHLKREVDDKTIQYDQLLERVSNLNKENASLKLEIESHRNRETILCNQDKDVNLCAILPPVIILLTILLAYLIGAP